MDVGGVGGGAPLGSGGPNAFANLSNSTVAAKATQENELNIGERLNQMSGVKKEDPANKPKSEMGKDAFLKLFMEQLKFQDPMNPVKNDQFNQQMAMFSQLEQQVNMNKNLEKMLANQNNTQLAALQLVGKDISADRGALYHEKDRFSAMNFKLPQDMKEVDVQIVTTTGEPVRSFKLDGRSAGDNTYKWDGLNDQGMPAGTGKYSYKVSGIGMDGKEVNINTKVEGRVTGVTSAQGVVFLMVGEQKVGLNDVELIKEAANPTTPAGAIPVAADASKAAAAAGGPPPDVVKQAMAMAQGNGAPAVRTDVAAAPSNKNWALSHDSLDEVPGDSDKEFSGTNTESNSTAAQNVRGNADEPDGGLPPMMPLFTR